ncbi:MAG: RNA polymerase sigma factor, partial [Acidimicrobiales bacterium]
MTSGRLRAGLVTPDAVPAPRADTLLVACFERDYTSLQRLAFLILGDRDLAEDVVQEAFLRTFTGWHRLRDTERAGAYLRSGVVNMCLTRIRRRNVEQRSNAAVSVRPDRPRPGDQPEEAGGAAWLASTVLEAVRELPPRQRAAVVLRYYADLSEAEMAAALGCAPGTVKSQLAKARATLAT